MTQEMIEKLEAKGFKHWMKGNIDRLYINASQLGLVCDYYKTGNIKAAEFNGERISNSQGYRYKASKTFVDVKTGAVHSDIPALQEAAENIIKEVGEWTTD